MQIPPRDSECALRWWSSASHAPYLCHVHCEQTYCFSCTSPRLEHGPQAIWSYLTSVLEYMKEEYPELSVLHIFSDGPVTQYIQKQNFYLYSPNLFNAGFTSVTWNFFEASHGKGAQDGSQKRS